MRLLYSLYGAEAMHGKYLGIFLLCQYNAANPAAITKKLPKLFPAAANITGPVMAASALAAMHTLSFFSMQFSLELNFTESEIKLHPEGLRTSLHTKLQIKNGTTTKCAKSSKANTGTAANTTDCMSKE